MEAIYQKYYDYDDQFDNCMGCNNLCNFYSSQVFCQENGAVTDISIVEENDTPQFFEYAKGIINTILNRQSLEVDGITGATYSSKGIQNAVYDALQNAVISGELKITDIQISNSRGHGKPHHRPEH